LDLLGYYTKIKALSRLDSNFDLILAKNCLRNIFFKLFLFNNFLFMLSDMENIFDNKKQPNNN